MPDHPMQPAEIVNGVLRFKKNGIIDYLFDAGLLDLNKIACMRFSQDDRCQIAQLLGYSVSGYLDLSYTPEMSDEEYDVLLSQGEQNSGVKV